MERWHRFHGVVSERASRWPNLVSHGPQEDGFADGATSGPCGLWAAACQWEPTLAALPLRQSPRTDGANAGLRSSAKQGSRNEQAQMYAAAGVLVSSWPLLVRRSAMGRGRRGGVGGCAWWWWLWQMCDWKKDEFARPWGLTWFLPPTPPRSAVGSV